MIAEKRAEDRVSERRSTAWPDDVDDRMIELRLDPRDGQLGAHAAPPLSKRRVRDARTAPIATQAWLPEGKPR
jgi:hypothetical protein